MGINSIEFSQNQGIITNIDNDDRMMKYFVLDHYKGINEDKAWEIIHKGKDHKRQLIAKGLVTDEYLFINTSQLLLQILNCLKKAGIAVTWSVDWYEAKGRDGNEYTGKHRIRLEFEIDSEHSLGKRKLCLFLYNSYDGSMRIAIFAGMLEILCLNGLFTGTILNQEDGQEASFRRIHRTFNLSEEEVCQLILEKTEKIAQAVCDYITKGEYKQVVNFVQGLEQMDFNNDFDQVVELTRILLTERVKLMPFYTDKFQENGGKVYISSEEAEKFALASIDRARIGQEGLDGYSVFMRLQETLGANPYSDEREGHMPSGVVYSVWTREHGLKDHKIWKFQLRNIQQANRMNQKVGEVFSNLAPVEETAMAA